MLDAHVIEEIRRRERERQRQERQRSRVEIPEHPRDDDASRRSEPDGHSDGGSVVQIDLTVTVWERDGFNL